MRWLYLWSSYRELAGGVGSIGRYAGSWSNIQGSTRNCENEGTTDNLRCMLYSVYAALSVNSWWWHGNIEMDDVTLCSCDDGRVGDKKERDGDEDESDMEDMSGYEKSGVRLAWLGVEVTWLGLEDHVSVLVPAGSGLVPAVSGMVNWLAHEIVSSPSFSWWFPPSPLISLFLVLNSTITKEHEVKSSLSISPCHNHELTPSTAYTKYSIIPRSTVSRS